MLKELGFNGTLIAAILQIIILLSLFSTIFIVIFYFVLKRKSKKDN